MTEIPEGDAYEQAIPVAPGEEEQPETPAVSGDVPEADALEQSIAVPADEEDYA